MYRRKFITRGLVGGASLVALSGVTEFNPLVLQSARAQDKQEEAESIEEIDIEEIQERVKEGELTYEKLTEIYIGRIAAYDEQRAALRSVLEVNTEAKEEAEELDRERKKKGLRSPLHGIPILIKDNIDTKEMETTAGSLALVGAKRAREAFIVERLEAAGAIILGKTNLSEWANFRSSRSTSGWSARGGQTRNPYDIFRNPCGSSSGTGAAVAANLCVVGIGTETDGSIVCPSNANGLVGLKPTVGLVSRSGIIPISASQDTAGPMTRTVKDAALVLNAIAGYDPTDAAMRLPNGGRRANVDYTTALQPDGLRGMRLGIVRKLFGFNPQVDEQLNKSIAEMKRRGAIIIDPVVVPTLGQFDDSELEVLLYEFKDGLNRYLANLVSSPVRTLKDVIEFNERHKEEEMPYFGQDLFLKAEAKGSLNEPKYLAAKRKNNLLARVRGIDAVMTQHKLDALVAPTGSPAWTTDLVNGDHYTGGSSSLAAVAGYPNITVPAGFVGDLPIGISFFGRAFSEALLLKIAYGFEQATKHRRAPKFRARFP